MARGMEREVPWFEHSPIHLFHRLGSEVGKYMVMLSESLPLSRNETSISFFCTLVRLETPFGGFAGIRDGLASVLAASRSPAARIGPGRCALSARTGTCRGEG